MQDQQEQQQPETPAIQVSSGELESIKQIECQVGSEAGLVNGECPSGGASGKVRRKARSTRRRLNAMLSNASLHFSDTDSEGELAAPRLSKPSTPEPSCPESNSSGGLLKPVISVTLDGSDDSSYEPGARRNSYLENLTDVDEIYTSEPETGGPKRSNPDVLGSSPGADSARESLSVTEPSVQGETDLEEMSNEDEEEGLQPAILLKPRSDILFDFNGQTITTKEGDGPFSIEVRNQMSLDEPQGPAIGTPDILVEPTTDSEDMQASDEEEEEEELEGACAPRLLYHEDDFDALAASQIVMRNVDKMEQLLAVRDNDDAISDTHTDVEDIE